MEGTIMYIAIDGNSTGKKIEKMILDNELEKLSQFSSKIQNIIQSISSNIIQHSGKIIMAGGDNILAEIPSSSYRELLSGIESLSLEDYSFSVAVSVSAQGAYLGLKYAKATNTEFVEVECHEKGQFKFIKLSI